MAVKRRKNGADLHLGNAHHEAWFSSTTSDQGFQRGNTIINSINNSNLVTLNQPHPTRLPTHGNPSSPDLSLISAHLATDAVWLTHVRLNSDHLPITIDLSSPEYQPTRIKKAYTNFRLADWTSFTEESERLFSSTTPSTNPSIAAKQFQKIVNRVSKRTIPTGYRKSYVPGLTPEIRNLTNQRDNLRQSNPTDPAIGTLNAQIKTATDKEANQTWVTQLSTANHKFNLKKFWRLIKKLNGKNSNLPPNQPIKFGNKTLTKAQSIANRFNKQFTSIVTHRQDPTTRTIIRRIHRVHQLDPNFSPFTPHSVAGAIRGCKNSTATGPDNMTILHLKHLGPSGTNFLCKIFNASVSSANIPAIWKLATIVPLPKPGKNPEDSKSHRPISLLCPASKILERLILPHLAALPCNPTQHGFKPLHSTTTALLPLTTAIAQGFNQPKPPSRTAAIAIDYSKAFDSIHHPTLLTKLSNSQLHPNIIRWLTCYLRGRAAACRYLSATSRQRIIHSGVPQGAVLSPTLFNFFTADCPTPAMINTSYADDVTIADSLPDKTLDASQLSANLRESFDPIVNWAQQNRLSIAPSKSSVTLFTPWTKQFNSHPRVTCHNSELPLEKTPKILGVTLDPSFTFTPHTKTIATRCSHRLNILKALAGTSWGHQKETLGVTFNALIKPVITYACPIWYPPTCNSNVASLQAIQNKALRIISGSLMMSSIPHLHAETKTLPVKEHLDMLCKQFLVSSLRPSHPSYHYVTLPSGPRAAHRVPTLQSRYLHTIQQYLTNGQTPPGEYESIIRSIHTSSVQSYLNLAPPNKVLDVAPPEIDPGEEQLPRHFRTTLSQLRSGYCSRLMDYRDRVGWSTSNMCPECGRAPHTVHHLFRCEEHPTTLTPEDLWTRPVEVAALIAGMSAFEDLPPLEPPAPPPPPEPPPPDNAGDSV